MKQFDKWFTETGHWIYASRAEAMRTWAERGIDGLPPYNACVLAPSVREISYIVDVDGVHRLANPIRCF